MLKKKIKIVDDGNRTCNLALSGTRLNPLTARVTPPMRCGNIVNCTNHVLWYSDQFLGLASAVRCAVCDVRRVRCAVCDVRYVLCGACCAVRTMCGVQCAVCVPLRMSLRVPLRMPQKTDQPPICQQRKLSQHTQPGWQLEWPESERAASQRVSSLVVSEADVRVWCGFLSMRSWW